MGVIMTFFLNEFTDVKTLHSIYDIFQAASQRLNVVDMTNVLKQSHDMLSRRYVSPCKIPPSFFMVKLYCIP